MNRICSMRFLKFELRSEYIKILPAVCAAGSVLLFWGLSEVSLCVVAVDGGCFGKAGDGAALGGLAGAVGADGVA